MRRPIRARASSRLRPASLTVDMLEARQLLSTAPLEGPTALPAAGQTVRPLYQVGALVANPNPPAGAYTPAQIASAYGFNAVHVRLGQGRRHRRDDRDRRRLRRPEHPGRPERLRHAVRPAGRDGRPGSAQSGSSSLPGTDSTGGWELEESLDVEWAHAMAPGAKIVLVEAKLDERHRPARGRRATPRRMANVVSMSWGGGEFSGENIVRQRLQQGGRGVRRVLGRQRRADLVAGRVAERAGRRRHGADARIGQHVRRASRAGAAAAAGRASYESQPSYQSGVVTQTTTRANPDVAYDASPSTGFAVYDSFNYNGTSYGWMQIGGTSAGAPQWAALLADRRPGPRR